MTSGILNLYKKVGETPLERLNRLRNESYEFKDATLSYAGRLDPLAEGVLVVLVGDKNKIQKDFFSLDKEYVVEVLLGFQTDTGDILGLVTKSDMQYDADKIDVVLQSLVGEREETYPVFSSKNVLGKPLFFWARNNRLSEIEIPKRKIRIDKIELLEKRSVTKSELKNFVFERVALVNGDFRQKEIIRTWRDSIDSVSKDKLDIVKIKVVCGEGAYMRTLAENIGKAVGSCGLAYSIKRTKVGEFRIEESIS